MTYEAVFFDLDGTLLDTIEDIAAASNSALAQFGLPTHEAQAYKFMVGMGARELCERLLEGCAGVDVEEFMRVRQQNYFENWNVRTHAYEGMAENLEILSGNDILLGVYSNKSDELVRRLCTAHFPDIEFCTVRGARAGAPLKPDPTVLLEMLTELSLSPADVLYVGDSAVDVALAKNAGLRCAGALWGFRGREELEAAGADYIITYPSEIMTI